MKILTRLTLFLSLFLGTICSQDSVIVWRTDLEFPATISPVIQNNKIFYFGSNGKIICLNSLGEFTWSYETFGTIRSIPVIDSDLLVLSTYEGDLVSVNINTGNLYQVIGTGEFVSSANIVLNNFEQNGFESKVIIAGAESGNLFCHDLYTLDQIWINQISESRIISSLIISDQKIFFYDDKGVLYCISSLNGLLIWKWTVPTKLTEPVFNSELITIQNNLYIISPDGILYCVDTMLGREKWNLKKIDATGIITINDNSELIIPTKKNKMLIISAKSGKITKEIELPIEMKDKEITHLSSNDNIILAGFSNGSVYELNQDKSPVEIFRNGNSEIISVNKNEENYLITDESGRMTLIKIPHE